MLKITVSYFTTFSSVDDFVGNVNMCSNSFINKGCVRQPQNVVAQPYYKCLEFRNIQIFLADIYPSRGTIPEG